MYIKGIYVALGQCNWIYKHCTIFEVWLKYDKYIEYLIVEIACTMYSALRCR